MTDVSAALILAKGQSKRLPGKNLKLCKGVPMFLVNTRKCLDFFEQVYVSSDSDEILALAKEAGAIPIKRGEELCGETPDITVYQHALAFMGDVECIVAVHANNPTLKKSLIYTVKHLLEFGFDEVMTCYPMEHKEKYHEQRNKIYGSVRGLSRQRILEYKDPYKPEPEVLLVDDSIEIETEKDYKKVCL